MRSWNASEIPTGRFKEATLRTLARKLRDWLNGILGEDGDSVSGEVHGSGGPSSLSSVPSAPDTADWLPVAPLEQPGPPEDWLRRVREGAPGLLLPVEQGGMPRLETPKAAAGNKQTEAEMISAPPVPVRFPREAMHHFEEARVARVESFQAPATSESKPWSRVLKQEFGNWFARGSKKQRSPRPQHAGAQSPAVPERQVDGARRQSESVAGKFLSPQAPREISIASRRPAESPLASPAEFAAESPVKSKTRGAMMDGPRSSEWGKQDFQALWDTSRVNRSAPRVPAESNKRSAVNPPSHAAPLIREGARPGEGGSVWDRGASHPADGFRGFDGSRELRGLPMTEPWPARDASALPANSRRSTESEALANRNRGRAKTGGASDQSAFRARASEPVEWPDRSTPVSGHSAKSPPVDPWPELPEEPARDSSEWSRFLRTEDRLRALDLEQRGGR